MKIDNFTNRGILFFYYCSHVTKLILWARISFLKFYRFKNICRKLNLVWRCLSIDLVNLVLNKECINIAISEFTYGKKNIC